MDDKEENPTYKIVRKYGQYDDEEVSEGLTLEEVKAHCSHPNSSSSTCTDDEGLERTIKFGNWFDAFYKE